MDTAFVIGNGESRPIFPIQDLKGKGIIYGCNAIYRDNPELCDHIVAVNQPMYEELGTWHEKTSSKIKYTDLKTSANGTTYVPETRRMTRPIISNCTGCGGVVTSRKAMQ